MARRTIIVNFLLLIALFLHGPVFAGTVQTATLLPGEAHITPGATAQLDFSAINDHTVDLKSYSVVFHYSAGLSISNLTATPEAATAKIDTRKNTISLLWSNVPVGSELRASFGASSVTVADYSITPDASKYVDIKKSRFTGTCNASLLQIRPEFVPPSAPSLLRSQSGDNAIHLSWVPPSDQDIAGYRIYRRTSGSSYNPSVYSSMVAGQASYIDSGVSADTIYSYVVSAVDNYGNESAVSNETTSMTINGNSQLLNRVVHGFLVDSAIGDFMGDGQADIIASNGASVTFYKDGADGRKATIPMTSPDAAAGLNGNFGNKIMAADLNNDDIDDLIVSDPLYDLEPGDTCTRNTGKVYVYAGGADFPGAPILTISGTAAYYYDGNSTLCQGEELGRSLATAGDVNADGYQDVVIGVPYGGGSWSGEVAVLLGGPDFSSGVLYAAGAQPRDRMGYNVVSAGDVNHDGKDDIVAGTSSTLIPTPNGKAYLIWGGNSLQPAGIPFTDGSAAYGQKVGGMDINNDGYSDILVSAKSGTAIHLGSAQPHSAPDQIAVSALLPLVDGFGDFNQDGYEDLLTEEGNVAWGDAQTLTAPSDLGDFRIYDAKDFDNDGVKDILVHDGNEIISIYSLAPLRNLPEIHLSSPGTSGVTPYPTEQISGSIRGEVSRLLVGGQDVPVVADGSFEYLWSLTEGENALEVIAVTPDNKTAKVDLTLTYTVPPPLTLTIDSPHDGTTINQRTVQVSGTVSDSSAFVTVNGIAVQLIANTFQAEVALTEGANTITVIASDVYGRSVSQNIAIKAITKGAVSGTVQNTMGQALADVAVTVREAGGASLSAVTAADGSYLVGAVSQGDVSVTFEKSGYIPVIENAKITAGETLTVNADLANIPALVFDIVSPLDGQTVVETPVTISGNISNASATVTVNGVTAAIAGNIYQADVVLVEGFNTLTAVATDPYGQSASASITLTLLTKGSISGKVTAKSSGLPVEGAGVSVTDSKGTQQSVATDANGDFLLTNIAGGAFTGTVSYSGYVTNSFSGNLIPGETLTINSALSLSPPLISNMTVIPAMDGAVITWTTDQAADSLVEYGATTSYGQSVTDSTLLTNHSLTLTGLSQGTSYHFKAASANSDGSVARSGDLTFTTLSPPVISDIFVSNITGNSATITWNTDLPANSFVEYGETAAYDLTAGDTALRTEHHVDLSGLLSGRSYHFRVSSTSSQGAQAVSADTQFDTVRVMTLTITSPVEGEILSNPFILVQGSITGSAAETGVTANGVIALMDNTFYAANHVSLLEGNNSITVRVTDTDGNIAEALVNVTYQPDADSIRLNPDLESGLNPLTVKFLIDATFDLSTATTQANYIGPAAADAFNVTSSETFSMEVSTPGMYIITADVADASGNVYSDSYAVLAMDRAALDTLLQDKWQGMKGALISGDITTALSYHHPSTKDDFAAIYTALGSNLASLISRMQDITLICSEDGRAQYRIRREHMIDGVPAPVTYYIYFAKDRNGFWVIEDY